MRVAIVHDYLTQRGGAERVALEITKAFPEATLFTTAYQPHLTFDEFRDVDVRVVPWVQRLVEMGVDIRALLPLLPAAIGSIGRIDADVVVCSSSGWGHGVRASGRKLVYCHNPARWLYQPEAYFTNLPRMVGGAMGLMLWPLRAWDRRAARSCILYLANSRNVAERVRITYGRESVVLHPPRGLDPTGLMEPVGNVTPGYYLTVSRKRGYKRGRAVADAFRGGPRRLVQVGGEISSSSNITKLQDVTDEQMRWLYANARALIAIGDEDFGLTPVECYAFGTPAIVLASGGYLETSSQASSLQVEEPTVDSLTTALPLAEDRMWDSSAIRQHAEKWAPREFQERLRQLVDDVARGAYDGSSSGQAR